jgi:mono/diheme cytochrome c family protein
MRRAAACAVFGATALLLTACGYEGTVAPTAATVVGPLPQATTKALPKGNAAAGKRLFLSLGCSGCHTYAPAGSHGQIGPDLGKLPQYARQANQGPLDQFIVTSITNPGAYIQPGYQNVMPNTYANLPKQQLADLLAFLTKKK